MTLIISLVVLGSVIGLAGKYGAESRPGFDETPGPLS